jgi:hypothetical protein
VKRIKARTAIACEYVSQTGYGKHTLVNVFGGDILVKQFPATFPIAFYAELVVPDDQLKELTVEVFIGRKRLAKIAAEIDVTQGRELVLPFPALPFTLKADSVVRLVVSAPGCARTTLLQKKVITGEFPG